MRAICGLVLSVVFWAGAVSAAEPRSGDMLGNTCAGCHGTLGASAGGPMPIIGGLSDRYLDKSLSEFKSGKRPSTVMGRIAKGYSDLELKAIASFFAQQDWVPNRSRGDAALVGKGRKIHTEQCATCHTDNGRGGAGETPRLAGQWPDYLRIRLGDLRDAGGAMPQPMAMRVLCERLSDEDIEALSQFYASQR